MIDTSSYDAVSFDVYGTILNWEPEIAGFLSSWSSTNGRVIDPVELLAAYDRIRQPIQSERPALRYPEVLKQTLLALGREFDVEVPSTALNQFSGIAATHQLFPDSAQALSDLRTMGLTLAALSNIDDASFAKVTADANISFDVVVTAQRVGAYKPDPSHFWAALADLKALGIPMHRVLHVAQSKRADIVVANDIGLDCVWVNRPGHIFGLTGQGAEHAKPDIEVDSLATVVRMFEGG